MCDTCNVPLNIAESDRATGRRDPPVIAGSDQAADPAELRAPTGLSPLPEDSGFSPRSVGTGWSC
jgi:hypothetical protein